MTSRFITPWIVLSLFACGGEGGLTEGGAVGPGELDPGEVSEIVEGTGALACGATQTLKAITASISQDGNPATSAMDGNLETRWSGLGVGSSLTADLGAVMNVCGVSIHWYRGGYRSNNFTVSVSTDGVTFRQVFVGTSALSTAVQGYTFSAANTGRYVRLTVNGNTENNWASVNEFQVSAFSSRMSLGAPGTYKPSAANTGVPNGVVLKPYNTSGADLIITQNGLVLDGLEIFGDIKVRAADVIIRNSLLRGGRFIPSANTGIVDANSAAVKNLIVEDCTITPDFPSYYRDGIVGHEYTSRRNHIYKTNDGLGAFNKPGLNTQANVVAEANYIHTLTYWSSDPAHSDGTHNDCIETQGGENIKIVGNTIDCDIVLGAGSGPSKFGSSAGGGIMVVQNTAKYVNLVIANNWLDNAQTTLNIDHKPEKGFANIALTVTGNRFGRNQFNYGNNSKYPIRLISYTASWVNGINQPGNTTNTWEDNGVLLQLGRDLGIRYNTY